MPEYGYSVEYRVHLPERNTEEWDSLYQAWLEEEDGEEQIAHWQADETTKPEMFLDLLDECLVAFAVREFGGGNCTDIVDEVSDNVWKYEGG